MVWGDNGTTPFLAILILISDIRRRFLGRICNARVALVQAPCATPDVFAVRWRVAGHNVRASAPRVLNLPPSIVARCWGRECACVGAV